MVEGGADLAQIPAARERTPDATARSDPAWFGGPLYGVARIRVELPPTTPASLLTRRHPEMVLVILSAQSASEGRVLAEVDVVDSLSGDHAREIRELPGVASVGRVGARQSRTRLRILVEAPRHLTVALELGIVYRYPVVVQDGRCTLLVEGEAVGLRRLLRELRRICPDVKLVSWGRESLPTFPPALSSRQQALLYQALVTGYFDVPRRITLTGLARQLHRSKSSVSRALSLIENRIVEASVLPSPAREMRTGSRLVQVPRLGR